MFTKLMKALLSSVQGCAWNVFKMNSTRKNLEDLRIPNGSDVSDVEAVVDDSAVGETVAVWSAQHGSMVSISVSGSDGSQSESYFESSTSSVHENKILSTIIYN